MTSAETYHIYDRLEVMVDYTLFDFHNRYHIDILQISTRKHNQHIHVVDVVHDNNFIVSKKAVLSQKTHNSAIILMRQCETSFRIKCNIWN